MKLKKFFGMTLVAASVGWGSMALALAPTQTLQGQIDMLDRTAGVLRLVDGTVITIPPNISSVPLEPGEDVTIAYRVEPNGQKQMTAVWVDQSPNDGSGR